MKSFLIFQDILKQFENITQFCHHKYILKYLVNKKKTSQQFYFK